MMDLLDQKDQGATEKSMKVKVEEHKVGDEEKNSWVQY
jgi:hypothetical protein